MLGSVSRRKVAVTDTSKTGWGTLCEGRIAFCSFVTPLMNWHIICLEMMVVVLAFKEFWTELGGHQVLVCSDSRTVVAFINHQGSVSSHPLHRLVSHFL